MASAKYLHGRVKFFESQAIIRSQDHLIATVASPSMPRVFRKQAAARAGFAYGRSRGARPATRKICRLSDRAPMPNCAAVADIDCLALIADRSQKKRAYPSRHLLTGRVSAQVNSSRNIASSTQHSYPASVRTMLPTAVAIPTIQDEPRAGVVC